MDYSNRRAVYCPVCAGVRYLEVNVLGEVKWDKYKDYYPEQKCPDCGYEFVVLDKPIESFHKHPKDNVEEDLYVRDKYVFMNHIINNPEYNQAAHIERLRRSIKNNTDNGAPSKFALLKLKEFCGIDMEQPDLKVPKMGDFMYCPQCGSMETCSSYAGAQYCDNCDNGIPLTKKHKNAKMQMINIDDVGLTTKEKEPKTYFGFTPSIYKYIWDNYVDTPENPKFDSYLHAVFKKEILDFFAKGGYCGISLDLRPKPKDASVVGRAVAGGVIAGPVGAVVGAASAIDKNMKNKK